jgi:DNA-binding transcriptional ArsR family regulator
MADLLPGQRDSDDQPDPPRIVGIDGDDADEVLSALSAGTAREILSSLHEEPATASEIADRVDTTLQNTQYHLDSLTEAGLVVETDTVYSEKGREMSVYGPADRALVVVAGEEDDTGGLRGALRRLLGTLLPVGGAAVAAELALGGPFAPAAGGGDGAESAGGESADVGRPPAPRRQTTPCGRRTPPRRRRCRRRVRPRRRCSTVSPPPRASSCLSAAVSRWRRSCCSDADTETVV